MRGQRYEEFFNCQINKGYFILPFILHDLANSLQSSVRRLRTGSTKRKNCQYEALKLPVRNFRTEQTTIQLWRQLASVTRESESRV